MIPDSFGTGKEDYFRMIVAKLGKRFALPFFVMQYGLVVTTDCHSKVDSNDGFLIFSKVQKCCQDCEPRSRRG